VSMNLNLVALAPEISVGQSWMELFLIPCPQCCRVSHLNILIDLIIKSPILAPSLSIYIHTHTHIYLYVHKPYI
jgi:hypothetical protein